MESLGPLCGIEQCVQNKKMLFYEAILPYEKDFIETSSTFDEQVQQLPIFALFMKLFCSMNRFLLKPAQHLMSKGLLI